MTHDRVHSLIKEEFNRMVLEYDANQSYVFSHCGTKSSIPYSELSCYAATLAAIPSPNKPKNYLDQFLPKHWSEQFFEGWDIFVQREFYGNFDMKEELADEEMENNDHAQLQARTFRYIDSVETKRIMVCHLKDCWPANR